jgi:hypothetical protein
MGTEHDKIQGTVTPSELYTSYNWSPEFKKLSQWAEALINEDKARELFKITRDRHNIVNRVVDKDLPDWIKNMFGVPISHVQLFSAEPTAIGVVHKDGLDRFCAFNIPVKNADKGTIEWLSGNVIERKVEIKHTSIRLLEDRTQQKDMTADAIILLENPTLINTDHWHRVNNSSNYRWRHVLSIRFLNNPSYQEVKQILDKTFNA